MPARIPVQAPEGPGHVYDLQNAKITLSSGTNVVSLATYIFGTPNPQVIPARAITLLADAANSDTVLVGAGSPTFPLAAGASITVEYSLVSEFRVTLVTGTANQVLHVIYGGY